MPRPKIDEWVVTATLNNDPLLTRYLQLFPKAGNIDLDKGEYRDQPMTDEQKEVAHLMNNTDLSQHLVSVEPSDYEPILDNVISRLNGNGIQVYPEYKDMLRQMARVMAHSRSLYKPIIVTARPGLGKTELLISTLIERSKVDSDYTAIVVTQHVRDAVIIRDAVNIELKNEVCFIRPTFRLMTLDETTLDDKKCNNGHAKGDHYQGICNDTNCEIRTCPAKDRHHSFRPHKIVIITAAYFKSVVDDGKLNDLMELPPFEYVSRHFPSSPPEQVTLTREVLFIDENPGMVFNKMITDKMLHDCMVHLKKSQFKQSYIDEYKTIKGIIAAEMGGEEQYEYVNPSESVSSLTDEFKVAWRANPLKDYYNLPEIVNSFLEGGGIRQNKNNAVDYAIGVNRYRRIGFENSAIRTVILDGTGIKDLTYSQDDFHFPEIPEIRDFSRARLCHYDQNISKVYLNNPKRQGDRIIALADEAIRVIGKSKGLFITYEKYDKKFTEIFEGKPDIDIKVEHYGNLIGRNDFRDRTAVFFAGINNWGSMAYFSNLSAVNGNTVDLSIVQSRSSPYGSDEVHEFHSELIAIGLYQDLMRSNLRIAGSNEEVNIYIWTGNEQIVEKVLGWLPGAIMNKMKVPEALITKNHGKKSLSAAEIAILDDFMRKTPNYLSAKTATPRAKILTEYFNEILPRPRIPKEKEFERIWGKIKDGHYTRYKNQAKKCLPNSNENTMALPMDE